MIKVDEFYPHHYLTKIIKKIAHLYLDFPQAHCSVSSNAEDT